jgi:hypothetical protein
MTLWGIGRLGWTPPEPWLEAAMEESFKLLPYLKPQEVANVVWAWSQLGTWPSQVTACGSKRGGDAELEC